MRKYLAMVRLTVADMLVYRMNFLMWRVRQVVSFFVVFSLWAAIYQGRTRVAGYSEHELFSYLIAAAVMRPFVFGTTTLGLGQMINDGQLTNILLRPIGFFRLFFSRDIADKALNVACSIVEMAAIITIFRPGIALPPDWWHFVWALAAAAIAMVSYFFLSVIVGFLGFWTNEVWAPRFMLFVVMEFLSGGFFPLDTLPTAFRSVAQVTPFPYLLYFPVSVWLGKPDAAATAAGFAAAVSWCVALVAVAHVMWHKGLTVYEAQGR